MRSIGFHFGRERQTAARKTVEALVKEGDKNEVDDAEADESDTEDEGEGEEPGIHQHFLHLQQALASVESFGAKI